MTLLSALGLKPAATVVDDAAERYAARLTQRLERRAYAEAEQLLANTSDENREHLIYGFACGPQSVPLAAQWAAECAASARAQLLLGASLIVSGWKIRGGAYAEDVEEAAWQPFLESLKSAEEPLETAARLDPSSADALAWLIHAEVGGSGDRARIGQLFADATTRVPLHWPAHYKYFMALTEKWGGSHREMFRFADETSKRAPRGSMLHSLIAAAYNEFYLAQGKEALKRIRTKEHAAKVTAALHAWLDASPDALSDKLERVGGGFGTHGLNEFAVACYLCGAWPEARAVVDALRDEIEITPWQWIATGVRERLNPAFVHDRVKRELAAAR